MAVRCQPYQSAEEVRHLPLFPESLAGYRLIKSFYVGNLRPEQVRVI